MKSLIEDKKFIVFIASALIILLIIGSILLFNKGSKLNDTSKTKDITNNYVAYIKINPSIKLEYTQTCKQVEKDSDDFNCEEPKVTNYELVNDDAKNIYKDIDLLGNSKDLFQVLNLICETAKENGIVFEKVDIYTDWNKIENYIAEKNEISETISFNIEITNKDDVNKKIETEENNIVTYNVSFDTNGGNIIESQVIKKDDKVTKPSNPTKTGYKFIEWQLDNKSFDFDTKINKDITLTAKWEKEENNNSANNKPNINNTNNNSNNSSNSNNNNTNSDNQTDKNTSNENNSNNTENKNDNNTPPIEEIVYFDIPWDIINDGTYQQFAKEHSITINLVADDKYRCTSHFSAPNSPKGYKEGDVVTAYGYMQEDYSTCIEPAPEYTYSCSDDNGKSYYVCTGKECAFKNYCSIKLCNKYKTYFAFDACGA